MLVFASQQDNNMDECKYLRGGVYLLHSVVKGKHQYEVENFLTCDSQCIVRKRDKVLMINNVETQDLPPELFAKMLKSCSPMLTWHAACTDEEGPNHLECQNSDAFQIFTTENSELSFSLAMVREDCLAQEEEASQAVGGEWAESSDFEDDSFLESNVLMVSMTNMRMEVVTGRGYESDHCCNSCSTGACSISRMVVTAKHCEVTSACSKYIFKYSEKEQCIIQSLLNTPITSRTVKRTLCRTYSTSDITIYYYQTNFEHLQPVFKGVPVVLNFTSTSNFLKCTEDKARPEEQAMLTVECCDKNNLQRIYKDDPAMWPFVFYMTSSKGDCRRFESAAHSGWFIHTINTNTVCMGKTTNKSLSDDSFYFFIFSRS